MHPLKTPICSYINVIAALITEARKSKQPDACRLCKQYVLCPYSETLDHKDRRLLPQMKLRNMMASE